MDVSLEMGLWWAVDDHAEDVTEEGPLSTRSLVSSVGYEVTAFKKKVRETSGVLQQRSTISTPAF